MLYALGRYTFHRTCICIIPKIFNPRTLIKGEGREGRVQEEREGEEKGGERAAGR